jgi:hypothetical protein
VFNPVGLNEVSNNNHGLSRHHGILNYKNLSDATQTFLKANFSKEV